jgi:murein DD-endopeptidase MepM/ murein hydrolase activator NlpD
MRLSYLRRSSPSPLPALLTFVTLASAASAHAQSSHLDPQPALAAASEAAPADAVASPNGLAAPSEESGSDGIVEELAAWAPNLDTATIADGDRRPVDGAVAAGFGTEARSTSATRVRHPGLRFAAPAGSEVRAVAPGRVVFVGAREGFGTVVIIDHGGHGHDDQAGFHTVSAHLAEVSVRPGDRVEGEAPIGRTDADDAFYFELRRLGDAIDPAPWLRRR